MKSINEEKLQKVLTLSYFEKDKAEIENAWHSAVMRRIRYLNATHVEETCMNIYNKFVWRFSATTLAIVIILSIYMMQNDYQTSYELSYLFCSDPFDISMVHAFGV